VTWLRRQTQELLHRAATHPQAARRDGEKEREELRARLGAVQRELAEADALRLEASSSGTETQERLTQAQRHAQVGWQADRQAGGHEHKQAPLSP
jgi:hypothetical protein